MKKIILLIFCLVFIQTVSGQRTKESLSAEEQKLSDELRQDQEYVQVSCERRQVVINPDKDTSYRLKAIQAFQGEGEIQKLKKSCGTIEGDPITSYLTVEKGKAQVFIDASQDKFGPKRVYAYQCSALDIGIYFNDLKAGTMVFQKIDAGAGKDQKLVLRCLADSRDIIF